MTASHRPVAALTGAGLDRHGVNSVLDPKYHQYMQRTRILRGSPAARRGQSHRRASVPPPCRRPRRRGPRTIPRGPFRRIGTSPTAAQPTGLRSAMATDGVVGLLAEDGGSAGATRHPRLEQIGIHTGRGASEPPPGWPVNADACWPPCSRTLGVRAAARAGGRLWRLTAPWWHGPRSSGPANLRCGWRRRSRIRR